jgi:N-acetylmuramoyl-L-alanine amidase
MRRAFPILLLLALGCASPRPAIVVVREPTPPVAVAAVPPPPPHAGTEAARTGDEIMVCGRLFHTGAPVVLWTDPGGYDAYRVWRRFTPTETRPISPEAGCDTANRYGIRPVEKLPPVDQDRIRAAGWDLPALAQVVDKFVIHYDVSGTSRQCFRILHDVRGLSVHFLLDVDGTIYQTLDLKERARHSGPANDTSVGVEIAQIGAYDPDDPKEKAVLDTWYRKDESGRVRIHLPAHLGDPHLRVKDFVPRPAKDEPVAGEIQGRRLLQYDFTDEQYRSLIQLAATLCAVFPKVRPDAPRGEDGKVRNAALSAAEIESFGGLVGHYHLTTAKIDPGPAFDWERVISAVREAMAWTAGGSSRSDDRLPRAPRDDERSEPRPGS